MSRLAKRPVKVPSGTEVQLEGSLISFKGPKGTISQTIPEGMQVERKDNDLYITMDEKKLEKPVLGLYFSLIKNAVDGVAKGFSKTLTLVGVGFRANLKGHQIELQLG
ncbi:MAG: 50S ribosomal protein L6, partial [Chlamydiales bacterium]|nr:50S ribosomal protein L6 [Chlamydiales bacterium]